MQHNPNLFLSDLSSNEKKVFDVIWKHAPVPRKVIAERTGLTSMSVTRLARSLQRHGLIIDDEGNTSGKRGYPARSLHINMDGAYSFGVSFSHFHIEIGLVNLHGQTLGIDKQALDKPQPDEIARKTRLGVDNLLKSTGIEPKKIIGIGFAIPGDFGPSPSQMAIESRGFSQLNDFDLATHLEGIIGFKCFIENDSTSTALGERVLGAGQNFKSFLFILLGHGIGAGLFFNGSVYRGDNGNAGIIGIHFPNTEPRPSGQNLLDTLHSNNCNISDFSDLESVMPNENANLKQWIRRAGSQLREKLSYPTRLIDPSAIIIGGRLPAHINQALVNQIDTEEFCNNSPRAPKPRVLASTLGTKGVVIGAAIVPIYQTLFAINESNFEQNIGI